VKLVKYLVSIFVVFFIFFVFRFNFFYPDPLYDQLKDSAHQNIQNLSPDQQSSYQQLMRRYSDLLIYFLIASEEQYKLELTEAEVVDNHYQQIKKYHWGLYKKYGPEFFLSYIAKITVSDELITPYRKLFKDYDLYQLKDISDTYQRVRELNLWCRQFVNFKSTSGRHQTPVDILKKSNLGRCEEMLILFISAARTIGIPARPAYTPLWAHTDGNHAWVEVFVDGRWQYVGAGESEYFLNQGWFNRNIDKMLLVLARSSLPVLSDQELLKKGLTYIINSTSNYALPDKKNIRNITFKVYDQNLQPVKNSDIVFLVFNRGMLRPFLRLNTANKNKISLDLGAGSFFVTADKGSTYNLTCVPYGDQDKVVKLILDNQIKSAGYQLKYSEDRESAFKNKIPARWQGRVSKAKDKYNQIVEAYQKIPLDFTKSTPSLKQLWQNFRNNKETFKQFYLEHKPEEEFLEYLALIDEKFFWQCNLGQLKNLYQLFLSLKEYNLGYPEEMIAVILEPGVFLEELSQEPLGREFNKWRGEEPLDAVLAINQQLKNSYQIKEEKAVYGLLPVDIMVEQKILTPNQYKILLCAVLRYNFIPAGFPKKPNHILVYLNGKIETFDFVQGSFISKIEKDEAKTVPLSLIFWNEHNHPIKLKDNQFTLTTYADGVFYPYSANFKFDHYQFKAVLPADRFYLHLGYRLSGETTEFQLIEIDASQEDAIEKNITLINYPLDWEELADYLEGFKSIASKYLGRSKQNKVFLFGDYSREIIQRLAQRAKNAIVSEKFYWIGENSYPDAPEEYSINQDYASLLKETDLFSDVAITLYYDAKENRWVFYQGVWEMLPE
jgi:hypothetical protein